MKKLLLLLLPLLSSYIFSGNLSSYNLVEKSVKKSGDQYEITIATPGNKILNVYSGAPLTPLQEDLIGKTYNTFYNWQEFKINQTQLVFEGNKLSIIFKIDELKYKDIEISQYLPSGIQMYYETFYEYDFRMFKDTLFMRMKGQYYSKDEFLEELYNAASDPLLYVQVHDPSYIIRQIDELRTVNNEQSKKIYTLETLGMELINNLDTLSQMHGELTNKHNDLETRHEELLEDYNKLQAENLLLTDAVISLDNRNFFGSLGEFDKSNIDEIIKLKKAKPAITVKEVVKQLKTKGIKVTNKSVEAVFMIYFGEFPQNEK